MQPRILVTGATGRTGRHVVSRFLARGMRVRAMMRNPESSGLPSEVEIACGDLTDAESLEQCLDGIDGVFLVWTAPAEAVPAAMERIARQVRRIVFLSSPHQTAHPLFQGAQPNAIATLHQEIEVRIREAGLAWTFLRPGMIAANALWWWAAQIRAGDVVRWPYAQVPTAPIDERDIAATAVCALCDEGHGGAEYMLTGPESLTHVEQVNTIGDAIGRRLRFEEITAEEWRRAAAPADLPVANMLLAAWGAAVGHPALVTQTVAEVTGVPARRFRAWAADHAAEFRGLAV
jgi:uncharacterized protein YbjT (DUF2867 family)